MASEILEGCNCSILCTVLGILLTLFVVSCWWQNRNLPPGPRGLPILGYYFSLGKTPHIQLKKVAETYGDVLCFRTLGGTPIIILNNLETVKDVLVNRSAEFIGRPLQENMLKWVDDGLGIAQAEGQAWKEQRRFFAHSAKNFGFGTIQIEGCIHKLLEVLIKDIRQQNGKPFDPYIHVAHLTCNVISQILFKKQYAKDDPEFQTAVEDIENVVVFFTDSRLFIFGRFLKFMLKFYKAGIKAENSKRRIENLIKSIVDNHVSKFDSAHLEDFVDVDLSHMNGLEEKGKLKDSSFTRERLDAVAMNMFMEGTGSVGSSLSSFILKLSEHPGIQNKAQGELDREVGRERFPSWTDRGKLPYLNAVIQELYRTSPIFLFSTYYSNFEETQINGYHIPKRSVILANLYSLNNDPELYPNPSKFDPEHFLDSSGNRVKKEGPFLFGIGKRSCIGEPLAQMEVFFIIATLLQNFTLYPAQEGKMRAVLRENINIF